MNALIESMLRNRGITQEQFEEMNSTPHSLPSGIPDLCERLDYYHKSQELIVLLTDFDADGIMTGVTGFAGLSELGFNVALYHPDTKEYGVAPEEIDCLVSQFPEVKCILTGDVGIGEFDTLAHARFDYGLEVLLTDHHVPSDKGLPPACSAAVDPMLDQDDEHFGLICGAHVMYLVLHYYAEHFCPETPHGEDAVAQIERLRVFAGIGTVTDMMPLKYENRAIVRDALFTCRQIYAGGRSAIKDIPGCEEYRRAFDGLYLIMSGFKESSNFHGFYNEENLYEDFFGFYAGPALNSIKRMTRDVGIAYDIFFGGRNSAANSMSYLLELNDERKHLKDKSMKNILDGKFDQPWEPYIYITDAPPGIRGLLAQDFRESTDGPTVVVAQNPDGTYKGSGRSPDWFPFLEETKGLEGVHVAGHEGAFGIIIDNESACDALATFLKERDDEIRPPEKEWTPDFVISDCSENADTGINISMLEEYIRELEDFRPFGIGFESPEGLLEFNPKKVDWGYLGKDKSENLHVKAQFPQGFNLVCFYQGKYFPNGIDKSKMPDITRIRGDINLNLFGYNTVYRSIQFMGELGPDMDQS